MWILHNPLVSGLNRACLCYRRPISRGDQADPFRLSAARVSPCALVPWIATVPIA